MLYTLKNEQLTVQVSDIGAELHSVKRGDCEYIWIGDPEVWSYKAPLVFPICGRFFDGRYTYRGKSYEMGCHGFIRPSVFTVDAQTETSICFKLTENEETKKEYPFDFVLKVWYVLEGDRLTNRFEITNPGKDVLPATIGGHPGFNVPLEGNGAFSDYYLEFGKACSPDEIVLSETCFITGQKRAYPLVDGKILPLKHELFSMDAVFMSRVDSTVTLKSKTTDRFVTLEYPDMPYLGIWHKPRAEVPYVCIEPWCGLPGYDGVIEDMETKHDMFRIEPGATQTAQFAMIFG